MNGYRASTTTAACVLERAKLAVALCTHTPVRSHTAKERMKASAKVKHSLGPVTLEQVA